MIFRGARRIKNYGLAAVARIVPFRLILSVLLPKVSLRSKRRFVYLGDLLPYLFHSYNNYGITERSVEMPIVRHYLIERTWDRVLEIGNVTAYYEDYFVGLFPNKLVVDKLEKDWKVITSDIADYSDAKRFDFIFSVSTFEHMDSDLGRNPDYHTGKARSISIACDNIRYVYENLLRPGGLFVVTAPMGYTPEWDATMFADDLARSGFSELRRHLVSRIGALDWTTQADNVPQCDYEYGRPFPYANHVVVLEIRKQ